MTTTLKFALFFVFILFVNQAIAQQSMGLQTCMKVLAKDNLTYKDSQLQTQSSLAQMNQIKSQKLPQIGISAGQNFNLGRSIDRFTNNYIDQFYNTSYVGLGIQVPIFQGFQIQNQVAQGKIASDAAQKNQEAVLNQQTIKLLQNYVSVLATKAIFEASQQQVMSAKMQVGRVLKQVEAGTVGQNTLFEIKAQLANDQFDEVTALNNYKIARLLLFQILNLNPDDSILFLPLENTQKNTQVATAANVYEEAIGFLPEIKAAELRVKSVDYQIRAIKAANIPSLNLSGNLSAFYASSNQNLGYFDQLDATRNGSLSLGLNIPIMGRWQSRPRVDVARVQQKIVDNQKDIVKQQLRQGIEQAIVLLNANQDRFLASQSQVESLKANFAAAETRLNTGTASIFEYTLAKANLARAEANNIRVNFELILQERLVEFYKTGKF